MFDSRGSATLAVSVPVEADTLAALEGVAKGCRRIGRQRGPRVHLPRGLYPTRRRFFKHLERLGVHEHGHFEQVGHFPNPVAAILSSSKADSSMGGTAHAAGRDSSHRSTSARRQPTARDPSPPNRIGGGKSPERMRLQSDVRLSPIILITADVRRIAGTESAIGPTLPIGPNLPMGGPTRPIDPTGGRGTALHWWHAV